MRNRWRLAVIVLSIIALGGALALAVIPAPKTPDIAGIPDLIMVDSPKPGDVISSSTVIVTGKARGTWYFEASFPVVLTDWDGRIIAEAPAQAQGEWMTRDFVPFAVTLTFVKPVAGDPAANRGFLILKKDNPSGEPAFDQSVEIPVFFK
ncbi:MAG: Gmad2 immunoglobulin-like domain-containing protein [Patescibacteria group bacterium]